MNLKKRQKPKQLKGQFKMSKAEENYKYALNSEKYDAKVRESVDKKLVSKKDANTVNKIQQMMQKERQAKQGMQEIDGSDHNSGRNDAVIYEHKRNK